MKICFYFPFLKNSQNNSLFGTMYSSFFNGLRKMDVDCKLAFEIIDIEGDVMVVVIGGGYEKAAAKAMHVFKGPVILYVHNAYLNFNKRFLKRWQSRILFAYNPDYATLNFIKYTSVNIPYYHFPFASDERIYYPLNSEKHYDITFLGNANSGSGRQKYIDKLIEYVRSNNLKIFLAGNGWDKYGYSSQLVQSGEQTNLIYNQSKICVNIHNDRQYLGMDTEMDANNRLFDLAMAQTCQITNGERMIRKYFTLNEVVAADSPAEWIQKIDYFLNNDKERNLIAIRARERALLDHNWNKRAEEFIEIIASNLGLFDAKNQNVNIFTLIRRQIDTVVPPFYLIKEIRIVRHLLSLLGLYNKK